ncbi:MAG TPA: GDSL-type esterase/lipase family protein [Opitutaceae bacterium]|nr:GDSL-type esterase/lipase family protein [Opitutaceae bacterium]
MHLVSTSCRTFAALVSLTVAAAAAQSATSFKFQFGAAQAAPGYTLVPTTTPYSADAGYGFEPGAAVTAVAGNSSNPLQRGAITSAQPFTFSVAVPEGNYRVTVTLGDPTADSTVTVKAEARRLMLEHLKIPAGKFETRTFTVNIRRPAISTGGVVILDPREWNFEKNEAISRGWDDKLTVAFSDAHPALAALQIEKMNDAVTLFILGDSTVTDQGGGGSSWGQMATRWFKAPVVVANHAESGETLKGFLKERRWEKVLDSMKAGDYVIIEFGTNDSKSSGPQNMYPNQDFAETYAPAATTYKELLKRFAADAQKKGGFPIIVSPSARRQDNLGGPGSLSAYAIAAMEAAKEIGVPSIDLNTMGRQINSALGDEAPKQFNDQTHHVDYGAYLQSKCIALGIRQAGLPLAKYIVDDFSFDPAHPEPTPANFQVPADPRPAGGGRGARAGGAADAKK